MVSFNDYRDQRWDPLGLAPLARGFEGLLSGLLAAPAAAQGGGVAVNLSADEEQVTLRAQVPGYGPGDVSLTLEGQTLALEGAVRSEDEPERVERHFRRRVRLPFRVDSEGVEATIEHGLLEVVLQRAAGDRPRNIEITEKS